MRRCESTVPFIRDCNTPRIVRSTAVCHSSLTEMYVKCNLPQPTTFKKSTVGTLTPHALHEACRASLSARPNAGRERASRDVLRDRERVLHERGRAARRRRLEAPRHLAETTRWCRASRNRSARAAGAGWTGRGTRAIERRPSGARHTHRGVVLRALLGDQEVRPDPTLPATRRVRTPGKFAIVSPRFSLEIAGHRLTSRACFRARGRAPTDGRAPRPRSANVRGDVPRVSLRRTRGGRRRPPPIDSYASRTIHDSSRRGVAQTPRFFSLLIAVTDGRREKNPTSARAGQGPLGRTRGGGEHAHRGRGRGSLGQS